MSPTKEVSRMKRLFAICATVLALVLGGIAPPAHAVSGASGCLGLDIPYWTGTYEAPIVAPRIIGKMTVGNTIKVTMGKWSFSDIGIQLVAWYRINDDGTVTRLGKPRGYYKIKSSDRGTAITALVVVVKSGVSSKQGRCVTVPRRVK